VVAIRKLIDSGHYESVQQFFEVAVENQLFLQKLPPDVYPEQPTTKEEHFDSSSAPTRLLSHQDRFLQSLLKAPPFTDEPMRTQKQTLWGLYNRVFPAKIALRIIANLTTELDKPFIDFMQVREEASKQARLIGKLLADDDEKTGRLHGEKLATGLPIGRQHKAITRYQDMFVGFRKSKGDGGGLLTDLGFAVIKNDEKGRAIVALTKVGADFAKLPNPVLDAQDSTMNCTLSEEEAYFYLDHIRDWLPLEYSLYEQILDTISAGKNTPEESDLIVKANLNGLKKGVLATERAGLISRLTELGMLGRKRIGLRVFYGLTQRGEQFLKHVKEVKTSS
jgi:hypothetical protein